MSRGFVLLFAPVALLIMMTIRYARIALAATIEEYWPSRERVAVAGAGEYALQLANQVRSSDDCRFVGLVLPASGPRGGATKSEPVLGDSSRIGEVINREKLDRIVIAGSTLEENEVQHCLQTARRMGVVATQVLGYSVPGARMVLTSEYGVPAIEWRPESTDWRADGVKRGLDFTFSLLLLIALSPLLLVIAALIKLTSAGPVFYVSTRAGKGGRHFRFLKFRTMRHGNARAAVNGRNEKSGHIFKIRQDPRITPVGRWLRRTSLDELPQLINVLRGEMSLVGPRPLPAEDLDPDGNSAQFAYWARTRSSVLPGITGLWQIRGRSELSFQQTMDFDIRYVEDWSLVLDARILLETPLAILVGRGAY